MHAGTQQSAVAGQTGFEQVIGFARQAPELAALIVMALVGLGISIYLTTVHYADAPLACSSSDILSCSAVTQSVYSLIPGTQLPITIPGMLWFLVSIGLAASAWYARARDDEMPWRIWLAQVLWGAAGLLIVIYLVYIEIVTLHQICEWCTGVHVLTALSFLVALWRTVPPATVHDTEETE